MLTEKLQLVCLAHGCNGRRTLPEPAVGKLGRSPPLKPHRHFLHHVKVSLHALESIRRLRCTPRPLLASESGMRTVSGQRRCYTSRVGTCARPILCDDGGLMPPARVSGRQRLPPSPIQGKQKRAVNRRDLHLAPHGLETEQRRPEAHISSAICVYL